ncbi:MAG: trigger factor [Betaproteobacteria bacterium SG8_40]|jgi:trigger factor|nr:MAG: trigger factor [Betaproteobacteria bacterium SG8_40]
MQTNLETLSSLERRLSITLPMQDVDTEVANRLKRLSRTVKIHGFRPGKVPVKIVEQQYGGQVRQEVLGDTIQKSFGDAVREQKLRVAGLPKIEVQSAGDTNGKFEYTATFEVYPEVTLGDLSDAVVEKPAVEVGDAEVDKTLEVLRKQRAVFEPVARAAASGDQVKIDYKGTIDGEAFDGGAAEGTVVQLGEGRLLPDFESNVIGLSAGETRTFGMKFPDDYHGKEVAGKEAQFEITVHEVLQARLPEIDAEFAKSLGVADGDLEKMRSEVRDNLQREVKRRTDAQLKDRVMKTLLDTAKLEVPQSLVDQEIERLMEQMKQNLRSRGVNTENTPLPREAFSEEATRRVRLGLIVSEVVSQHGLSAKPEQVKEVVEEQAKAYEQPDEVRRWYYQSPDRLREIESVVLESNLVKWVVEQAKVEDKPMAFDDLMGSAQ